MANIYVLYSSSRNKTYVGCSRDWSLRLAEHNAGKVKATSAGCPWTSGVSVG